MKLRVSVLFFLLLELSCSQSEIASNDPFKNMFPTTTPKPSKQKGTEGDSTAYVIPIVRICPDKLVYAKILNKCVIIINSTPK
jgi:hypothetical protein